MALSREEREKFLSEPHIGALSGADRPDRAPLPRPLVDQYRPGGPQPSFDKQFLRDYLETLDWGKKAPAPALPAEIVRKTAEKYLEALTRLTGITL